VAALKFGQFVLKALAGRQAHLHASHDTAGSSVQEVQLVAGHI
jgi:hypothetical protein